MWYLPIPRGRINKALNTLMAERNRSGKWWIEKSTDAGLFFAWRWARNVVSDEPVLCVAWVPGMTTVAGGKGAAQSGPFSFFHCPLLGISVEKFIPAEKL
jgi:hypothetical protein